MLSNIFLVDMMYLEYDKCFERIIKKIRVVYVIIFLVCIEYVRKFDEWNRFILVIWIFVFWWVNYLKLFFRCCKVVFVGCYDGVIE